MKYALFAAFFLLSSLWLCGCVEEGHSADCSAGGRGNLEEGGCVTPVGGGCLTEEEFKANRPSTSEDARRDERTIDDDWISYQFSRPECDFECLTEAEFLENRTEDPLRENAKGNLVRRSLTADWEEYLKMRPACNPAP